MSNSKTHRFVASLAVALLAAAATVASAQSSDVQSSDALSDEPAWQPPRAQDVKQQALAWLKEQSADQATLAKAAEFWSSVADDASGDALLEHLAKTFALVDLGAAELLRLCSGPKSGFLLPSHPWLTDPKTPPLLSGNMRLLYGRWLVHQNLFDEAREQLDGLSPGDVVAPALLLFYQGVAHHTMLDKEAGLNAIEQLLDGAEQSPRRYVVVAEAMRRDLEGLEDDSLDHIARRMDDVRRRLDLGRGGKRVREVEDGVIESLDKLIKKVEEQQKQCQQGSGAQDNIRSRSPAPDSMPIGGKGRGDVTRRNTGSESGWGDLPPKEREAALQQIGRDFPSHYRDIIEQYFRRLAAEGSE